MFQSAFESVTGIAQRVFPLLVAKAVLAQDVRENPAPCISCAKEVSEYVTVVQGIEFKVWPQNCESCRIALYSAHLKELDRENHSERSRRCSGHQNAKISHGGVVVGVENYKRIDSQAELASYMLSLLKEETKAGAYIYGPTGTGKTYLMKILNNELVRRYRDVCFMKAVDLALVLRKETFGDAYKSVIQEFRNVDVLIVDDFGTQKNTDFVKEAIFSIFDSRYDAGKITIITSNMTLGDLEESDKRLASRIGDEKWMRKIAVKAKDLRQVAHWDDF